MISIKEKILSSSLEEAQSSLNEILIQKSELKNKIQELETKEFYWRDIRNHFLDLKNRQNKFSSEPRR